MSERPVRELSALLSGLDPVLDQTAYCFVPVAPGMAPQLLAQAIATFREDEGVCAVVPEQLARELDVQAVEFARITLCVLSDLEAVGLTAAVATALTEANIACNVVAALHHDHVFVPWARRDDAMSALQSLTNP